MKEIKLQGIYTAYCMAKKIECRKDTFTMPIIKTQNSD